MEVKPNMKDSVANDPRDTQLSTLAESPLSSDDDDPSRAVARKRRREDEEYFKGLPPWYKFCCNDEDLVRYFLKPKVFNEPLPRNQIIDANIYLHNPDFLAEKYKKYGENELYFFTPRERKHRKGSRPNRVANDGYWRATGVDKKVVGTANTVIGFKKSLVFYKGKPSNGVRTIWMMHEYRINNPPPPTGDNDKRLDDWVLCRMYKKKNKARTQEEEEEVRVGESASTTALPNNGEEEEVRAGESGATTALPNNGAQPGAVPTTD